MLNIKQTRVRRKRFRFKLLPHDNNKINLIIKGPLGYVSIKFPLLMIRLFSDNKINKLFVGTTALANAVFAKLKHTLQGLIYGYFAQIDTEGVGFKFLRYFESPHAITLSLGHTHTIVYNFPKGVYFRTLKYKLLIFSKSKRLLSETANKLRGLRPPDPYKGKGLKFAKEVLVFKPGKQRQK